MVRETTERDRKFTAVEQSRQWLLAVLDTAEMLRRLHGQMSTLERELMNSDGEAFRINARRKRAAEHFFLIALAKSMDWARLLRETTPEFKDEVEAYRASYDEVRSLRNMREHDLDYFQGKGNRQEEFIVEKQNSAEGYNYQCDASSTVVNSDGYLIGGRLNVGAHATAAAVLLKTLNGYTLPFDE